MYTIYLLINKVFSSFIQNNWMSIIVDVHYVGDLPLMTSDDQAYHEIK